MNHRFKPQKHPLVVTKRVFDLNSFLSMGLIELIGINNMEYNGSKIMNYCKYYRYVYL